MENLQTNSTNNFFLNHFQIICWHMVVSRLKACTVRFLQTKAFFLSTLHTTIKNREFLQRYCHHLMNTGSFCHCPVMSRLSTVQATVQGTRMDPPGSRIFSLEQFFSFLLNFPVLTSLKK